MPLESCSRPAELMGCISVAAVVCFPNCIFLLCFKSSKCCKGQFSSSCAICQQSLLRRYFSGSSSSDLPFFFSLLILQGEGCRGEKCACEGISVNYTVIFFPDMDCKGNKNGKA